LVQENALEKNPKSQMRNYKPIRLLADKFQLPKIQMPNKKCRDMDVFGSLKNWILKFITPKGGQVWDLVFDFWNFPIGITIKL